MLQYGYEIRDVYSNSAACAPAEANTWTAQRARTSPIWYTCAGYILTGGYGKLGDASNAYQDYYWKDYSGLYTHNFIYFTMTLWILDSWSFDMTAGDYDDTFRIEFDGVTLSGDTWNTHNFYYDYCGDARYKDLPHVRVFGRVAHTGPTLRIRVVNLCDEESTNESLAFREINLLFAANAPASTPSDMCVRSIVQPRAAVPSAVCPCSEGYWSNLGVCTPCHSSCASCFGAGNSLCYQCKVGYSWTGGGCSQCFSNCAACIASGEANCVLCMTGYRLAAGRCVPDCPDLLVKYTDGNCIDRCTSSCGGNYIYWDGSCNSTCITPLQQDRLIRSVPHCVYPCDPTDYLYWDGTCLQDCEEPLLASVYLGKNFCNYPCAPAAEYLYWNGTCLASCLPPFVVSTSHGRLFCEFKCNVGAYLYWDGRCSAECKFPLTARITDGNLYCDYPCEYNAYLYWDGSCEQSCAPLLTPSTTGTIRPRNYCDYPGDNTTYLYWNSSLLPVCDPPFETRIFKGMKYCENPCPASYYIHWNISCMSTCPTPGVIRQQAGLLYCDFPCKEDEFYYWDGTCVKNCPDPYIPSVIGGIAPRKICDFECLAPYFSYWNGSCLSSCDPPNTFKVAHGRQFCHFACERTEFYYYNDTCRPNCPLPFIPRQEAGIEYCDHPCLGSGYITQWNYTCIANCDLPYRKLNNPFSMDWCRLPCDDAQAFINITTGLCSETCEGTAEKQDDLYFICIPHPPLPPPQGLLDLLLTAEADFRDPSFISLNKLTYPIRYVDIYLPPRLEKLLQSKARNIASWNIEVSRPDKLVASFPGKPMVNVYQSSSLTSSFILNFWPNLMFLGVAILSGLMFQMLTKVFEIMEWDHFYWIFQKFSVICTWNFLLVLMGYYADDLAFFMCLDIQYNHVDNLLGNVSLFVALAVFTVFMLYLLLMLYIMQRVQMIQKIVDRGERTEEYEKFCQGWRWCLAFYRPFNSQDWKQQIFYLIYILRLVSVILVTALGHQYPLLQTSYQAGANVFILGYILLFNPLKRTANTVQILCYEVGAATSNICFWLLMLIHLNPTRFYNWAMIVYLGDMIILANVYLNIAAPIFLIVKAVIEIDYIYRRLRYDSSVDRAAWVRLVVILIQQGAFGFEELLEPAPLVIRTRKMKLPQPNRQIFPAENSTNVGYRGNETTRFFIEGEEGERTTVEPTINYGRRPRNMKFEYDSRMDDPFVWRMYDTDTPGFDQSREEEIISGPIVPVMREDPEDRAETLSIPDDNQNNSGFFGNTQSTSFFKGLYHLEGIVPVNNNTNNNFNRRNLESIAEEQESPHIDRKIYF